MCFTAKADSSAFDLVRAHWCRIVRDCKGFVRYGTGVVVQCTCIIWRWRSRLVVAYPFWAFMFVRIAAGSVVSSISSLLISPLNQKYMKYLRFIKDVALVRASHLLYGSQTL